MAKITLWYPRERPAYVFVDADGIEVGPMLSPDDVFCDVCNAEIVIRPVPVVGSYALCLKCLQSVVPGWRQQVSKETQRAWQEQIK